MSELEQRLVIHVCNIYVTIGTCTDNTIAKQIMKTHFIIIIIIITRFAFADVASILGELEAMRTG